MSWEQITAFAQSSPLLSIAFVGLSVAIVVTEIRHRLSGVATVGNARLTELLNHHDALLVDVSPATDFEKGHIPGAISLPLSQFDPTHKALAKAQERDVVVICRQGISAVDAARKLVKAGFKKVHVLDGGVANWRAADLPLAKGRG
jgi:rhodanese-related sulfurtransferase